ncbi:MAG: translocation/assembly module TamB domain-containing protein [Nodosilinea sp.]
MAYSPDPKSAPRFPRLPRWLGVGLVAGSVLMVGAGVAWRGWLVAQHYSSPWLSGYLSELLGRPVELGPLQWVGPTGVRVGRSTIPPTTQDPDRISLEGIEVRFNPLDLFRRELPLVINLDQARVYLQQADDGQWVDIHLHLPEQPEDQQPWFEVRVGQVNLHRSQVTLVPAASRAAAQARVVLEDIQGEGKLTPLLVKTGQAAIAPGRQPPQVDRLDFKLQAMASQGGKINLTGSVQLPLGQSTESGLKAASPRSEVGARATLSGTWLPTWLMFSPPRGEAIGDGHHLQGRLNARIQALQVSHLMPLVQSLLPSPLPVQVTSGEVNGQVEIGIEGEAGPSFTGTARLEQGGLISPALPRPLQQIQATVRFQGQTLNLENLTARLGDLRAIGGGKIDLARGYDLKGQIKSFSLAQLRDLWAPALQVPTDSRFEAEAAITGPLTQPLAIASLASIGQVKLDKVGFERVAARATLQGSTLQINGFEALPTGGGAITAQGQVDLEGKGQVALTVKGDRLPADVLAQPYGLPQTIKLGPVFVDAQVTGPLDQVRGQAAWRAPLGTYPAQGRVSLVGQNLQFTDTFVQIARGTVAATGSLVQNQWQARLRATNLHLQDLGSAGKDSINGEAQLAGRFSQAGLEGQARAQVNLAGGKVEGAAILTQGQWRAAIQGKNLNLAALSSQLQGRGQGQVELAGSLANLSLAGVRGQGHLVLSEGLASASPQLPSLALAVAPLTADLAWDGESLRVNQARTTGLVVKGVVTPQFTGVGTPGLASLDLYLQARDFNLALLPLPDLLPVAGLASFNGRLVGSPTQLNLKGDARLKGLTLGELAFAPSLAGPVTFSSRAGLTIDLQGGEDRLRVATDQGDRRLDFLLRAGTASATGYTRGDTFFAQLRHIPLDRLKLPQGATAGVGTVSGTVETATVSGNWRQPSLWADFDIVNPGLGYLKLRTVEVAESDSIALVPCSRVEASRNPNPAATLTGQPCPQGSSQGENTAVISNPSPAMVTRYGRLQGSLGYRDGVVSLAGVRIDSASGRSRYLASGAYNLKNQQMTGQVTVDNGQIQDILLTLKILEFSDFRLNPFQAPPWFRLPTATELSSLKTTTVGNSSATLLDQLRRFAEVKQLQGIKAAQAKEALLPPLEGLQGSFSGTVTARGTLPQDMQVKVNLSGHDWLWNDPTHPDAIAYRVDGLKAQGTYQDGVIRFSPLSLRAVLPPTDRPPTADHGDDGAASLAELNGEFSLKPQDPVDRTLRLNVTNVPVAVLRRPLRLPPNLNGQLTIGASLTGGLDNPQIRGRVAVNQATINDRSLDLVAADFLYRDARLSLRGDVATPNQADPLTLLASVPYVLPGVTRKPDSDEVSLRLKVADDGFALINLLTQAITWQSGKATLDLDVKGHWPQDKPPLEALTSLVVTGTANFDGVTISSASLPDPLTNLRGKIRVVEDGNSSVYLHGLVLDFQNLQGDLSQGEILAQGKLKVIPSVNDLFPGTVPLNAQSGAPNQPLSAEPTNDPFQLSLNNLALNWKNPAGIYNGKINGKVVVDGSLYLLEPLLSGEITLSDGVLTLPVSPDMNALAPGSGGNQQGPSLYQPLPPVFKDFKLTLGNNLRLAIPALVDVKAMGSLDLGGTFPAIKPAGRITLPAGRITLLTTEFRLTGNDNYAQFDPKDPKVDPYLVANLSTAVPDSAGGGTTLTPASPFPRNEISESPITQLGLTQSGVQTIRIRASVNGRASRLVQLQGVRLESTPPRTEAQIVALLSGGILNALESTLGSVSGGGDRFQGLLTFAGSALLNRLQSWFEGSLDNVELRFFSASPPNSQQVDIGGDLGFNLSPDISVSLQKVFTNLTPTIFSIRYRIDQHTTLRAVTSYENFNQNTGAILEFRF